jgi:hypothetical protein
VIEQAAPTVQPPSPSVVSLLDVDPDLAALVPPPARPSARRRAVARVAEFPRGPWVHDWPMRDPAVFGLLVLDGLVGARSAAVGQAHVEVRACPCRLASVRGRPRRGAR